MYEVMWTTMRQNALVFFAFVYLRFVEKPIHRHAIDLRNADSTFSPDGPIMLAKTQLG